MRFHGAPGKREAGAVARNFARTHSCAAPATVGERESDQRRHCGCQSFRAGAMGRRSDGGTRRLVPCLQARRPASREGGDVAVGEVEPTSGARLPFVSRCTRTCRLAGTLPDGRNVMYSPPCARRLRGRARPRFFFHAGRRRRCTGRERHALSGARLRRADRHPRHHRRRDRGAARQDAARTAQRATAASTSATTPARRTCRSTCADSASPATRTRWCCSTACA